MRIVIWIDSSFAVEWLLGAERAGKVPLGEEPLGILPMQYLETFAYFLKKNFDPLTVTNQLEALEMVHPEKIHLQSASALYLQARKRKSKASLADALLAAVAHDRKEKVASFDGDFDSLGLVEKGGLWLPK